MKRIKSEKGAITMITLITVLFMVSFLMASYVLTSNKNKTQKEIINETKELYKPKLTMEEIYNSYFTNDNIVPIYTVEHLFKIGHNEKIEVNGKIYTFSNTENTTYLLNEDLEFNSISLGLPSDWIPLYQDESFLGNFDWNGHTIKVITLSGETIIYDGTYLVTTSGNPLNLTKCTKSNLVDYKIYGNSIQNGTPSPDTPVEVQSVGDEVNLFNFDMVQGQISGTPNYDNKSILLPSTSNLYIMGQSFTGTPTAFEEFNKVLNITEAGYYCLKVKVTCDEENIIPRANWNLYVSGDGATAPILVEQTQKDGYMFVKYQITEEILESLKTKANTFRLYMYAFRKANTQDNVDVTISEITFLKGDYTIDTMPEYGEYGKYRIPVKVSGNNGNEQTFNIILDEPLRKVGKYADYIDLENGKIVRKVGKYELSSSNTWTVASKYEDGTYRFYIGTANTPITNGIINEALCNYFEVEIYRNRGNPSTGNKIFIGNDVTTATNMGIQIRISTDIAKNITELFTYLDNLSIPLTVYNPLATPVEETIDLPNVKLYRGINIITVDTEIQPSNVSVTYNAKQ